MRCIRCRRRLADGEGDERWYWCPSRRPDLGLPDALAAWSGEGRFELLSVLGQGGAGRVFLATDRTDGAEVAVKMLAGSASRNPRTRARFLREIEVSSSLDDPGVVRVVAADVGEEHEAWVAMERVRGPSLREVLADGPLPVDEAVRVGLALARTLARLHRGGLAHRDVKPSNVLMRPDGTPLLTDFGLVALLSETRRQALTTHAVGTPAYMAPEQAAEPMGVHGGRRVDQFALGLLVEECATGQLMDRSALEGSMLSGSQPALGKVLAKAHHPDPRARYPDMDALVADLERVQAGQPVRARPPGAAFRLGRGLRRHRAPLLAGVGSLVAVAALVAAGSTWWSHRLEAGAVARLEAMEARAHALREAGRADEARAVFDAFVALPENQGRDALAQAWLARGRRDLEKDTLHDAIDSLSRAFVAAMRPDTRAETASVLDGALRQAGRHGAAHTLRQAYPEAVAAIDEVELLLEAGDVRGVRRALPEHDRRRRLVERLQVGTELPARVKLTGDIDGDGHDDDLFLEAGHPLAMPLDGFPVRDVADGHLRPFFDGPYWLKTTRDGGVYERLVDGTFVQRCPFDARGFASGGLGPDGVWLLDQQAGRAILNLDPATCETSHPFPQLDAMGSYPLSLDLADLDGDGVDEAVVSMGPPSGHGVWVMGRDADGDWEERAEVRLGYVMSVQVLDTAHGPRIVANATHFHPNPTLFPEPPHLGADAGQHVLAYRDEGLEVVQSLRSRPIVDTREGRWVTAWSGHVDDDGFPDVVTTDGYVYLSTSDPAAPFERVPTGHTSLDFIVDIDEDGLVEVGATVDGRTWMLGVGEASPRPPGVDAVVVEDHGDPALDGARALERIGLVRQAAEAYARIGRGRSDEPATDALVRAAELLGEEHPRRAAEAAEEAASRGRGAMVPVAVRRYLEALDPEAAQRVLERHPLPEDEPLVRAVAAHRHRVDLLQDGALPDGTRSSELVRWEGDELQVQTVLGAGPLLRVPLRQTGELVGFHVTLTTEQMEFASQLDLHLSNGEGQPLALQLVQRERGGTLYRFVGEVGWGKEVELASLGEATRFDVQLVELPDTSWVAVEVRHDGLVVERTRIPRNRGVGEAWVLELSAPAAGALTGQMGSVRVERLEVVGLEPEPRDLPFRSLPVDASLAALASDPTGRPLLHGRLRRDPMLFADLVQELGDVAAYGLTAEAFRGLSTDAVGLLPLLVDLDVGELARACPELAGLRAELLCRVGRRSAGLDGLEVLPVSARCRHLRRGSECVDQLPVACDDSP